MRAHAHGITALHCSSKTFALSVNIGNAKSGSMPALYDDCSGRFCAADRMGFVHYVGQILQCLTKRQTD